jgi:peptide deformylase
MPKTAKQRTAERQTAQGEPSEAGTAIRILGDPILRRKAKEVRRVTPEIRKLIEAMCPAMYANDGIGLAAPQIGESVRVITYDVEGEPEALINPKIVKAEGEEKALEGCLSVPRINGEVTRAQVVKVRGLDENGKLKRLQAEGLLARVLQHEIDHLDGVLFIDRAAPETLFLIEEAAEEQEDGRIEPKL